VGGVRADDRQKERAQTIVGSPAGGECADDRQRIAGMEGKRRRATTARRWGGYAPTSDKSSVVVGGKQATKRQKLGGGGREADKALRRKLIAAVPEVSVRSLVNTTTIGVGNVT
jgi:hypothetical protein